MSRVAAPESDERDVARRVFVAYPVVSVTVELLAAGLGVVVEIMRPAGSVTMVVVRVDPVPPMVWAVTRLSSSNE